MVLRQSGTLTPLLSFSAGIAEISGVERMG